MDDGTGPIAKRPSVQLQISILYSAQPFHPGMDGEGEHGGQDERNQDQSQPVPAGDGSLRAGCDIIDPAGTFEGRLQSHSSF